MNRRRWSSGLAGVALGMAAVAGAGGRSLTAQGVRYSVAPAAAHFRWDDRLGLEDVTVWGGRAGATFGRLVSLDGYYFRRGGIATRLEATELTGPGGIPLVDQEIDLQHWGVDLRVNLGGGSWYPFATGGAGVMRFEPASGPRFDRIVVKYGGGLQLDLSAGLTGQIFVENNRFRLDRYRLATPGAAPFPADPDADRGRDHLSFGAALGIALGAGGDGPDRERWSLASIPVEPFVGRLEYDDASLDHQWFGGVRAGIDLGQYFGLRGYYLRGVDDDVDDLSRVQSYGAEAQFNFNRGVGPAPFLIAGVGRLDFMDRFTDGEGRARSDHDLFIVGAGLGLRLSDQLRLNFAVRDWITSSDDFETIGDASELQHNLMVSAGIAFALGRGRTRVDRDDDSDRDEDRIEARVERRRDDDTTRSRRGGRGERGRRGDRDERADRRGEPPEPGYVSDRTATFPVPAEGEVYIRYGRGVSRIMDGRQSPLQLQTGDSALRAVIREELRSLGIDSTSMSRNREADSVRAEDDSLRIARIIRETIASVDRARGIEPRPDVATPDVRREQAVPDGPDTVAVAPVSSMAPVPLRRREPAVYVGFGIDDPNQFVIGGLIDMTPLSSRSRFRFLPELAVGFGSGGTSFLAAANVGIRVGSFEIGGGTAIIPQARLGFGLLTFSGSVENRKSTQGVLNLTYGFATNLIEIGSLGRPLLTVEHQGIDLFDVNRLLIGLSWRP